MESYLREKTEMLRSVRRQNQELLQKFLAQDLLNRHSEWDKSRDENPEFISDAEITDDSARIITTELMPKIPATKQLRYRYHLRISADNWEIHKKERECFMCHGNQSNNSCKFCGGDGWRDYLLGTK
jgi:hypothetical protein